MIKLLNEILSDIKPSEKEEAEISKKVSEFIFNLNSALKKMRIKASAAAGGSFAKGTTIKKDKYDVDIFAVFDRKYDSEKISEMLEKALKTLKIKYEKLPGSRDYYSIGYHAFKIEAVPVLKASKPSEAKNITDLSLLHVSYITRKIKQSKKLGDEIRIAKALCYANNCYGAESHIKGFSGYCLELLTSYYKSFENLVRAAGKWKQRQIIDPAGYYKKKDVMSELNESKLISPLILIDPVQKDRNAAAALSDEKFNVFISICKGFIKNPSKRFFERKFIDENSIIKSAKKSKSILFKVIARSDKIKEDTAGSKLLKLFNLLNEKLKKEGYAPKSKWDFKNKEARMWFSLKKSKKLIKQGPPVAMQKHVSAFKKQHKKTFVKNKRIFAIISPKPLNEVFAVGKNQLDEMGISKFQVIEL